LLYNSETWTLKEASKLKLKVFEMRCRRRIKGVTRRDRIRNVDIREEVGVRVDAVKRIQGRKLRYFGHVVRMRPDRLPNVALFGHVHEARRKGRPHKRWINNLDEDVGEMNLNVVKACRLATYNRHDWRKSVMRLYERGSPSPRQVKSSQVLSSCEIYGLGTTPYTLHLLVYRLTREQAFV